MKKKLIIVSMLITIITSLFLNFNTVEAYTGEIDPENYITMPSFPIIYNGKATGTIYLSSKAQGYKSYYQKMDLTEAEFNKITESTKKATTKAEMYSEVPAYTNSWIQATDNKVNLEISNKSGKIYFIIWVKITNGTNTYYDVELYSTEIKNDTNQTTDASKTDTSNVEWTDFSKAKYELKREGIAHVNLEISGVTPQKGSIYYLFITSNNSKPNVTSKSDEKIILSYDEKNKIFKGNIEKYVELNQDLYANILEETGGLYSEEKVVVSGEKLKRFAKSTYTDAFTSSTRINNISGTTIVTTFPHDGETSRKFQTKVGKITNIDILKKIKNEDASGFSELLKYAKKSKGIYDKTLDSTSDYYIGRSTEMNLINLEGMLEDDEYYFLYVKLDDENGKYDSNEAVTFAKASVITTQWTLFFYGDKDFKWTDWGTSDTNTTKKTTNTTSKKTNTTKDNTTAKKSTLPKTGLDTAMWIVAGVALIGIGVYGYKQYKRYNI